MQVGDLVRNKYNGIGIIVKYNTGGWWVQYHCGARGFANPSDLEVISESR
tara:strand:+ start:8621 stop:8770 length:150 start_codon:yes stop_codon:yes gene_type:complete